MSADDDFCPYCDFHNSLHPNSDGTESDCHAAQVKAGVIDTFGRLVQRGRP